MFNIDFIELFSLKKVYDISAVFPFCLLLTDSYSTRKTP